MEYTTEQTDNNPSEIFADMAKRTTKKSNTSTKTPKRKRVSFYIHPEGSKKRKKVSFLVRR